MQKQWDLTFYLERLKDYAHALGSHHESVWHDKIAWIKNPDATDWHCYAAALADREAVLTDAPYKLEIVSITETDTHYRVNDQPFYSNTTTATIAPGVMIEVYLPTPENHPQYLWISLSSWGILNAVDHFVDEIDRILFDYTNDQHSAEPDWLNVVAQIREIGSSLKALDAGIRIDDWPGDSWYGIPPIKDVVFFNDRQFVDALVEKQDKVTTGLQYIADHTYHFCQEALHNPMDASFEAV